MQLEQPFHRTFVCLRTERARLIKNIILTLALISDVAVKSEVSDLVNPPNMCRLNVEQLTVAGGDDHSLPVRKGGTPQAENETVVYIFANQ